MRALAARRRGRRVIAVVVLALTLAVVACTRPPGAGGGTAAAPVPQLDSIGALRQAFNADAGATRLVLLISPT